MLLPFARESIQSPEVIAALHQLASHSTEEERGTVLTSPPIVEAILDLVGYTPERDLTKLRLLEPSCGAGDFLLPALERLLQAHISRGGEPLWSTHLADALVAVEIHTETLHATQKRVYEALLDASFSMTDAQKLSEHWLRSDDFLLTHIEGHFDFVVGNPPYVRQERIPGALLAEYRARYKTLYDRADLYILFYERGLDLLSAEGQLGFICADRWLKNKYGGPLREKIATQFHLHYFIDLALKDAFQKEVLAYPSITVIQRKPQGPATTIVAQHPAQTTKELIALTSAMRLEEPGERCMALAKVAHLRDPWLLDAPHILGLLRRLEQTFPTLEEDHCQVGIGVATGCDRVFIDDYDALPVEEERKLPLAMAADIKDGQLQWQGKGILNPFAEDGSIAALEAFPRFESYLLEHQAPLKKRYVAKKNPLHWYKTIDRITASLTYQPKLLVPDIKGDATVVFDPGRYYPHHNLYVITSETWDLQALQAILRSSVALMFVAAYSVRMSGGYLRFQAQYLRRIRVPRWSALTQEQRTNLINASTLPQQEVDKVVFSCYALQESEVEQIQTFAQEERTGHIAAARPYLKQ